MRGEVFKTSYPVCKLKNISKIYFYPKPLYVSTVNLKFFISKWYSLVEGGSSLSAERGSYIRILNFLKAKCYVLPKVEDLTNLNIFFNLGYLRFYFNSRWVIIKPAPPPKNRPNMSLCTWFFEVPKKVPNINLCRIFFEVSESHSKIPPSTPYCRVAFFKIWADKNYSCDV